MTPMLDQIKRSTFKFCPRTLDQFFALQLAIKLDDTEQIHRYLNLTIHYPEHWLVQALGRAMKRENGNLPERFDRELQHLIDIRENE